ncbi:hypothetical protein LQZ18_03950 [Lachnospiraceae bacterium ZAX-1]
MTSIAENDEWIDVENEYLSCILADEAYQLTGETGFVAPDTEFPKAPTTFLQRSLAMGLRHGTHFLAGQTGSLQWLI